MAEVRPFCAVRPAGELAAQVAALPYDVYNRKEASLAVRENTLSFLNIDRAETQFPDEVDAYEECVYEKARELFEARMADGTFLQADVPCYYIYRLTMDGWIIQMPDEAVNILQPMAIAGSAYVLLGHGEWKWAQFKELKIIPMDQKEDVKLVRYR